MGLVINPTAFRIGHVKAWTDAWYLHRMHYPVFVHKSLEIKTLLQYILWYFYPSKSSHWIYSHSTFYYLGNKFYISLFVYDGHNQFIYKKLAKQHKWGWYRKINFMTYWKKRELLDQEFAYQRWVFICQALNFDFESLQLDSITWRLPRRQVYKIRGLRKKYGSTWTAREEIFLWHFMKAYTKEGPRHNQFGMKILNLLYRHYIYDHMKNDLFSYDFDRLDSAFVVLKSYRSFFFYSYIEKILMYTPTYPKYVFNRMSYKLLYRSFHMFFVYKPYWIQMCKIYELILLYINVNSKMKVFVLENRHLNAAYIARYITTCLRAKYDYRDTMIPIRKTLDKLLYVRRWRSGDFLKRKGWHVFRERYNRILKDRRQFHLINNEFTKLSLFRFKLLQRLKTWKKKFLYRKFIFFDFIAFRKSLVRIKKRFSNKKFLLKSSLITECYKPKFSRFNDGIHRLKLRYLCLKDKKKNFSFLNKKNLKRSFNKKLYSFRMKLIKLFHLRLKYYRLWKVFRLKIYRLFILRNLMVAIAFMQRTRYKRFNYKPKLTKWSSKLWRVRKNSVGRSFLQYWKEDLRLRFLSRWKILQRHRWKYLGKHPRRYLMAYMSARRLKNWRRNRIRRGIESTKFPVYLRSKRIYPKYNKWGNLIFSKKIVKPTRWYRRMKFKSRKRLEKILSFLDKHIKYCRTLKFKSSLEQEKLKNHMSFFIKKIRIFKRMLTMRMRKIKFKRIGMYLTPKLEHFKFNEFLFNPKKKKLKIKFYKIYQIFLYDKSFFRKFFNIYTKKVLIRGYSNLIFFNFLNQYTARFKPFLFDMNEYKKYIKNVMNLDLTDVGSQFVKQFPKTSGLEETPLQDKFKRMRILENGTRSILYGYKFHFVGRFTRKQKAASLWFSQGANSVSAMHVDVDYGFYTVTLRYSACTLKVWLYKNKGHSYKYGYRLV